MNQICVITEITGAGWECATIGYFKARDAAIKAVTAQLKEKGMKYEREDSVNRPTVITISVDAPYYLKFEFAMQALDEVKI
jgi:hypothetical protein